MFLCGRRVLGLLFLHCIAVMCCWPKQTILKPEHPHALDLLLLFTRQLLESFRCKQFHAVVALLLVSNSHLINIKPNLTSGSLSCPRKRPNFAVIVSNNLTNPVWSHQASKFRPVSVDFPHLSREGHVRFHSGCFLSTVRCMRSSFLIVPSLSLIFSDFYFLNVSSSDCHVFSLREGVALHSCPMSEQQLLLLRQKKTFLC